MRTSGGRASGRGQEQEPCRAQRTAGWVRDEEETGLIRGEGAGLDKASCTRECEQAWEGPPHKRTPGHLRTRFLPIGTVDFLG